MTTPQPPKSPWQLRVYPYFTVLGWILISLSLVIGIFVLSTTAGDYLGTNSKSVRDAALVGSGLQEQLSTIAATPRWLEPLTFLGVAAFMIGIALEFSSIPNLLKNRGEVMGICFPVIAKQSAEQAMAKGA